MKIPKYRERLPQGRRTAVTLSFTDEILGHLKEIDANRSRAVEKLVMAEVQRRRARAA